MSNPRRVFICYSHADAAWKDRLVTHLTVFERQGAIKVWHDGLIGAGDDWQARIERAIGAADVAVFLASPDALASEFINSVELEKILERRRREGLRLVPVLLRPCVWESLAWLAQLQCRPSGRPLSAGNEHQIDDDLTAIATEIAETSPANSGNRALDATEDSQLRALRRQKADARAAGDDARVAAIEAEMVAIKRGQRAGGQLQPRDFLGDYELIERRGKGGFATVWKAWDDETQRFVAVKVLHADHAEDRSRRERFFRGARQMAALDHPGIVRVFEPHGIDDGWRYFVMEFIDGEDLDKAVRGGRVDAERGLAIVLDVAEALQYAHSRKVVHRDVTPANIVLDREGRPHLTDFDLVHAAGTTGGTRTSTMGKWVYAPPEMMKRPQDADARSDVYSLGMTLAFVYAGGALDDDVLYEQARYLAELPCASAVRDVIARAIKRRMNERLATIAEFAAALRAALETTRRAPSVVVPTTPKPAELWREPATGITFVWIPPGEFLMGKPPGVKVKLTQGFWIGQHPVTNEVYGRFLAAAKHREPEYWRDARFNKPDQPVVGVNWHDAIAFCSWATKRASFNDDREVTLPTEAQWEYTARAAGGDRLREYPWGDEPPTPDRAVFAGSGGLASVGGRPAGATPLGVHDLAGNVWEWCLDVPKALPGGADPLVWELPESAASRVLRGGFWDYRPEGRRAADRSWGVPDSRLSDFGFRVVCVRSRQHA